MSPSEALIDTDWLQRNLERPDLVLLDCTWHLPEAQRKGHHDFERGHIPGACFFDLELVRDRASPYANMLPPPEQFAEQAGALGVGDDSLVVVYDAGYVAARVWWMFRVFGHDRVHVLEGGWRRWVREGRPVATGAAAPPTPARFEARMRSHMIADWRAVLDALEQGGAQVVDARTRERFTGAQASGYPGVPGGHMPGARNVPWSELMDVAGDWRFLEPERARRVLREAGVDLARPVITTCGSGVTAAVLGLALERAGCRDWKLYDGSWHEWGQRPDLPKSGG